MGVMQHVQLSLDGDATMVAIKLLTSVLRYVVKRSLMIKDFMNVMIQTTMMVMDAHQHVPLSLVGLVLVVLLVWQTLVHLYVRMDGSEVVRHVMMVMVMWVMDVMRHALLRMVGDV